ncbi:MAG: hypothetical protein MUE98_00035 [Rhodobacteraceae bacterium]|jgi:hypothetical protein|nr:hypothetical protein [Paracoccaceae bacterium]
MTPSEAAIHAQILRQVVRGVGLSAVLDEIAKMIEEYKATDHDEVLRFAARMKKLADELEGRE